MGRAGDIFFGKAVRVARCTVVGGDWVRVGVGDGDAVHGGILDAWNRGRSIAFRCSEISGEQVALDWRGNFRAAVRAECDLAGEARLDFARFSKALA